MRARIPGPGVSFSIVSTVAYGDMSRYQNNISKCSCVSCIRNMLIKVYTLCRHNEPQSVTHEGDFCATWFGPWTYQRRKVIANAHLLWHSCSKKNAEFVPVCQLFFSHRQPFPTVTVCIFFPPAKAFLWQFWDVPLHHLEKKITRIE